MVKKLTAAIIMMIILVLGADSYAADTLPSSGASITRPNIRLSAGSAADIKTLQQRISSNSTQLKNLRARALNAYKAAKAKTRKLMNNKEDLTQEQVEMLKQAADTLKADSAIMKSASEDMASTGKALKDAKANHDLASYRKALNDILTVQRTNISNFKKVISDLNGIARI